MNGYMGLFLETGDPAFYMMARKTNESAGAAHGGAARSAAYGAVGGATTRSDKPETEEEASPR